MRKEEVVLISKKMKSGVRTEHNRRLDKQSNGIVMEIILELSSISILLPIFFCSLIFFFADVYGKCPQ